jgi:hypothetical protein
MESLTTIDSTTDQQRNMTRFLIGILIYSLSTAILAEFIPGKFVNLIQLFGLGVFAFYWLKLASWKNISSRYLRITVSLLILWQVFIVCNGFLFQYAVIKEHLFSQYRTMSYLLPVAVFVTVNNSFFLQKIADYAYKMAIIFVALLPFLLSTILGNQAFAEQYMWILGMPCGFLLLTFFYHSKKRVIISFIVMFLSLFIITIMARRNIMFTCAAFLLSSLLIIPLLNKNITIIKKGIFLFSFITIAFIGFNFFISNETGMFGKFTKRASEDTREMVTVFFFLDMTERDKDFIIGRGLNATYFCPGVERSWSTNAEDKAHRDLDDRIYIESGFLQLILNGGIIYLVLYMIVLIPAIIKGLFFSRNLFVKGCAILILLFILDMIPFGLPTFSFRHFIAWFCVAICFSKEMRWMSEEEIKAFLTPKGIQA